MVVSVDAGVVALVGMGVDVEFEARLGPNAVGSV